MAHAETESVPSSKRMRTRPPVPTPDHTRDSTDAADIHTKTAAGTALAISAAATPLPAVDHSRVGIHKLPATVLGHALGWLGSSDLGGLAGTSPALRLAAIRHLRSARDVTLDMRVDVVAHGHAYAQHGCAVRGIRLMAAHLAAATHIRRRTTTTAAATPDSRGAVTSVATVDGAHIDLALSTMIARNAATLQSVDLSADGSDSFETLHALAACPRLTSFVLNSDHRKRPWERPWESDVIHTLVARNAACLTMLRAQPMGWATYALALRLPLEELRVSIHGALDLDPLSACTTLRRLFIGERDNVPAAAALSAHKAIAHALPRLTALQDLHLNSLYRHARGPDIWALPPALARLRVECVGNDTLPLISGAGVAVLDLSLCDAALVARLVPCFRASLRELRLEAVTAKPAGFLASLATLLFGCPRLCALRLDQFAVSARTLAALVAACPLLAALRAQVHSSFRAGDLAAVLGALQDRIRELDLYYGPEAENALLHEHERQRLAASHPDQHSYTDAHEAAVRDRDEALAIRRMPPLVLPHLAVLKLHMCTDRLLRKLTCPCLTASELVGAGVRLRRPLPPAAAFPHLERLALRVATVSSRVARMGDGHHARVVALSLSWEGAAEPPNFSVRGALDGACHFRPATLTAILACCPAVRKLAFVDRTLPQEILAALAGSEPSQIRELVIRTFLTAAPKPSDQLLADARALRTRHPLLSHVDVPCPHAIDPRLAHALFAP